MKNYHMEMTTTHSNNSRYYRLAHYHHIDNRLPDKKPVRLMWKK
ncbi:hypothetical protein [Bacteroides cellulosilyticus]|nr:hypothetical protein [Bacteroides cellulosilyticus]